MIPALLGKFDCPLHLIRIQSNPWFRGGLKESGIGRENGIEALEACESITVVDVQTKSAYSP